MKSVCSKLSPIKPHWQIECYQQAGLLATTKEFSTSLYTNLNKFLQHPVKQSSAEEDFQTQRVSITSITMTLTFVTNITCNLFNATINHFSSKCCLWLKISCQLKLKKCIFLLVISFKSWCHFLHYVACN